MPLLRVAVDGSGGLGGGGAVVLQFRVIHCCCQNIFLMNNGGVGHGEQWVKGLESK